MTEPQRSQSSGSPRGRTVDLLRSGLSGTAWKSTPITYVFTSTLPSAPTTIALCAVSTRMYSGLPSLWETGSVGTHPLQLFHCCRGWNSCHADDICRSPKVRFSLVFDSGMSGSAPFGMSILRPNMWVSDWSPTWSSLIRFSKTTRSGSTCCPIVFANILDLVTWPTCGLCLGILFSSLNPLT